MNEIRIKISDHIAKQWAAAAKLRGLTVTSFVVATVSEALLRNGELSAGTTSPSAKHSKPTKQVEEYWPSELEGEDESKPLLSPELNAELDVWVKRMEDGYAARKAAGTITPVEEWDEVDDWPEL